MMTNVKKTAGEVRLAQEALTAKHRNGVVPIISIEHPEMVEHRPGVVMEATPYVAARCIVRRTHKVASAEEHEEYKHQQQVRTDELRRLELEKKGVATQIGPVVIPPRERSNSGKDANQGKGGDK